MQKSLAIAVLVFGIGTLLYWWLRVVQPEGPIQDEAAVPSVVQSNESMRGASAPMPALPNIAGSSNAQTETTGRNSNQRPAERAPLPASAAQPPSTAGDRLSIPEPIPTTPGHRKLFEMAQKLEPDGEMVKAHNQFANEPRDPDWAYAMEQQLSAFFLSRASQLGIEVPVVACRTSGCEIQMTSIQNPPLFNQLLDAARNEPWYAAFDVRPMGSRMDNVGLFWIVLKRR